MTKKRNRDRNQVSVGPSGSGALSPRLGEKGEWMRSNLAFVAALAAVVVAAAIFV
jgi:hypothetical protein